MNSPSPADPPALPPPALPEIVPHPGAIPLLEPEEAPDPRGAAIPGDSLARGALFMVAAAFFFAAMSAAVKAAAVSLPLPMVVFFRNAVALVVLAPWVIPRGWTFLATEHLGGHLLRGLAGLSAMACFFYAISRIRLADAVLLNYTLPLFLPLVERLWLGEAMPRRLGAPLGLGFLGILVILRPGSGVFEPAALLALTAGVLAAVAQVGVRRLTATEPVLRIVFYFALIATVVSGLSLPLAWRAPSPGAWAALVASGVLATVGQLFLTRAYASATAAWVGPFLYTSVIFSGLFDGLIWGVIPDGLFLLGALLVIAAAALTLRLRQRR